MAQAQCVSLVVIVCDGWARERAIQFANHNFNAISVMMMVVVGASC